MEQALIVRRWRRYGADRLYVTGETGAPLGSVDLVTGAVAVEGGHDEAVEAAVRGAVQAYLRADLPELVLPASAVASTPGAGVPIVEAAAGRPRGRRARRAEDPAADASAPASAGAASATSAAGTTTGDHGRTHPDEDAAHRGRHRADDLVSPRPDGEPRALAESLCDRLDRLVLDGWHVLHDVPVGRQGSVVPHLLVGPPGAFAVAERDPQPERPERFTLDGRYLSADSRGIADLRDVRLTAARAGSLLRTAVGSPVPVRGVLVVHGHVDVLVPSPYDALVVDDGAVPDLFTQMTARWTRSRVDAVAGVARRRTTWALTWAV
ncbi:MAG TPA: NERD domain-containing protein [Cellulomonas sp.]